MRNYGTLGCRGERGKERSSRLQTEMRRERRREERRDERDVKTEKNQPVDLKVMMDEMERKTRGEKKEIRGV